MATAPPTPPERSPKESVPVPFKDLALIAIPPVASILATLVLHISEQVAVLLVVFLITVILIFWRFNHYAGRILNRRVSLGIPFVMTLILAGVMIFVLTPRRQGWDKWSQELYLAATNCQGANKCLAETLDREDGTTPISRDDEPVSQLVHDLTVGHIVEDTEPYKELLMGRLGISAKYFVGSGYSLPVPPVGANNPMLPEYLVPNFSETQSNVWVWAVDMDAIGNSPLKTVLFAERPQRHNKEEFKHYYSNDIGRHLDPGDPTPALVRFAIIDPSHYSHCLGILTRTRVFASPLGLLLDSTVQNAAMYSGYLPGPEDEQKRLFIFVVQPTRPDEAIRATWGNLMHFMDRLLEENDPCPINSS